MLPAEDVNCLQNVRWLRMDKCRLDMVPTAVNRSGAALSLRLPLDTWPQARRGAAGAVQPREEKAAEQSAERARAREAVRRAGLERPAVPLRCPIARLFSPARPGGGGQRGPLRGTGIRRAQPCLLVPRSQGVGAVLVWNSCDVACASACLLATPWR